MNYRPDQSLMIMYVCMYVCNFWNIVSTIQSELLVLLVDARSIDEESVDKSKMKYVRTNGYDLELDRWLRINMKVKGYIYIYLRVGGKVIEVVNKEVEIIGWKLVHVFQG